MKSTPNIRLTEQCALLRRCRAIDTSNKQTARHLKPETVDRCDGISADRQRYFCLRLAVVSRRRNSLQSEWAIPPNCAARAHTAHSESHGVMLGPNAVLVC